MGSVGKYDFRLGDHYVRYGEPRSMGFGGISCGASLGGLGGAVGSVSGLGVPQHQLGKKKFYF